MGRMFALLPIDETAQRINLKCDPELALHLRAAFEGVLLFRKWTFTRQSKMILR